MTPTQNAYCLDVCRKQLLLMLGLLAQPELSPVCIRTDAEREPFAPRHPLIEIEDATPIPPDPRRCTECGGNWRHRAGCSRHRRVEMCAYCGGHQRHQPGCTRRKRA